MSYKQLLGLPLAAALVLCAATVGAGIIGMEECMRDCSREYERCRQNETAESIVEDISCHEIREMCGDRCRNITGYVSCKDQCGDDRDCLQECKDDFKDNVSDYRPYLNRRNN